MPSLATVPAQVEWLRCRAVCRDRPPDRMQRLLNRASWDRLAVMGAVRRFAAAGLEEAARRTRRRGGLVVAAAIDGTGQQKAGERAREQPGVRRDLPWLSQAVEIGGIAARARLS